MKTARERRAEHLVHGGGGVLRPERRRGRNAAGVEGTSDGSSFEIDNVGPGRYWVEPSPFEGYVSSITSGGVDLARDPLVVGAGSTSAPIEVTLRNDSGTISAQLATGEIGEQSRDRER